MPYLYTCRQCRAQSPERRAHRADAEDDRQEHRDTAHGGLEPLYGDQIRAVHHASRGDRLFPRHTLAAGLFMLALVLANCWGR
jgi:hypothetical protein